MKKKEKNSEFEIVYFDDGWKKFARRQKRINFIFAVVLIVLGSKVYYKNKEREQ